jgi:hypothetical protein
MIKIRAFQGMIPRLHPSLIPQTFGQVCNNARMRDGAIRAFRTNSTDHTLAAPAVSFTKVGGFWRGFAAKAWVVQGPVATDRVYISGDGVPRVESVNGTDFSYPLALAKPVAAPTVAITAGTPDPDTLESIVFVYTWVTSLDEESPPSSLSAAINYSAGVTIRLSAFSTTPAGRGITKRRIYRSVTDYAGVATLYFVGEIVVATTTFDYSSATAIAEPISTTDFTTPPSALTGFTAMPNGIIAGFVKRNLYFCEPYKPHAWPIKYQLTTDFDIVGLAAFGSSLAVMTTGTPYIVQGIHPESMAMMKIEENLPCVSARGIVDLGYAAAYPSNDGLVVVSVDGAKIITGSLFTRDDWQALKPATFNASRYEGRYCFFYTPTSPPASFGMIDLTGDTPFYVTCSITGLDLFSEIETDRLFFLDANGTTVRRFDTDAGTPLTYTWRSKRFVLSSLVNFPWVRVDADIIGTEDVATFRLYGNGGTLIHEYASVAFGTPLRLPAGRLDDVFEIELTGDARIFNVGIAFDPNQLTGD